MKADMNEDGVITIRPESSVEAYALRRWNDRYNWQSPVDVQKQVGYQSLLLINAEWPQDREEFKP